MVAVEWSFGAKAEAEQATRALEKLLRVRPLLAFLCLFGGPPPTRPSPTARQMETQRKTLLRRAGELEDEADALHSRRIRFAHVVTARLNLSMLLATYHLLKDANECRARAEALWMRMFFSSSL